MPPKRVTVPVTPSHPYKTANPNALMVERDQMQPVIPPEQGTGKKIKPPKLTNYGVVTGTGRINQGPI